MKLFYILLFISANAYSQNAIIKGIILDSNFEPIPFVNIGMPANNIGTISNDKGYFQISIKNQFLSDSLVFSCIGYEVLKKSVTDLLNIDTLVLKDNLSEINEVVVSAKSFRKKTIGVKIHHPLLSGTFQSGSGLDIFEFAQKVEIKTNACKVLMAAIYLKYVTIDSAYFRINFYDSKDGLPNKTLISKSIIKKVSLENGWLIFDLNEYQIYLDKDFFIGFEYLPTKITKGYPFSFGGNFGGTYFSRDISLGKWKEHKGASISMYIKILQ